MDKDILNIFDDVMIGKPKLFIFDTYNEEIDYLCSVLIKYVEKDRFKKLGSICVISRYNKTLEIIEDKLIGILNLGKQKQNNINYSCSCNYIKYNNKIIYDKINLSTIHSSKGLEFDNVYFVNSSYDVMDNLNILQEIRLYYVATTRAKKQLIFSCNKEPNKIITDIVLSNELTNTNLIEIRDNRKKILNQKTLVQKTPIPIRTWIGVTDFIKLLSGEHIINIKKHVIKT